MQVGQFEKHLSGFPNNLARFKQSLRLIAVRTSGSRYMEHRHAKRNRLD